MEPPTRFPKQLTPEIPDNGAVRAGGRAPAGRLVSAVNCISIQQMANQEISARISLRAQLFLLDALHQVFGGTLCEAASLLLK